MSKILIYIPQVTGSSQISGYEHWIEVDSASMVVDRPVYMQVGQVHNRESKLPAFDEIMVHKPLDQSSHQLFAYACSGKVASDTVQVHFCSNGPEYQPYFQYELENVKISHYEQIATGRALPAEHFRLHFTEIQLASMLGDAPQRVGYDLEQAKLL